MKARLVALMFCGLSLGWLVGLSDSPVIKVVISAILSLVVGAIGAVASIDKANSEDRLNKLSQSLNLIPICVLVISIALGASLGVYARTHNWLGRTSKDVISYWRETGLDSIWVARQLFLSEYASKVSGVDSSQYQRLSNDNEGVLHSYLSKDECSKIRSAESFVQMKVRTLVVTPKRIKQFVQSLDSVQLSEYLDLICLD